MVRLLVKSFMYGFCAAAALTSAVGAVIAVMSDEEECAGLPRWTHRHSA